MKKIAISQPNYLPWIGYFQLINYVDEFVLFDDVQYTKRDWRNRNCIPTKNRLTWLTIPVDTKNKRTQLIKDVKISNQNWKKKHFNSIKHNYKLNSSHPFFSILETLYDKDYEYLIDIQTSFLEAGLNYLEIDTPIVRSSNFNTVGKNNSKLINICKQRECNVYVSGQKATNYLEVDLFENENIEVEWFNYDLNFNYNQSNTHVFNPYVSILDFIFSNEKDILLKFKEYKIVK